jgi:anthranilate synthase component 1
MIVPSRKEFLRIAAEGKATLIPVSRSLSADLQTPVSAFFRIAANQPHAFLLESVEGGEKIGRYTFLGAKPYCIVMRHGNQVTVDRFINGRGHREVSSKSALTAVRDILKEHTAAHLEGLPPFTAGAVGFLSYDMVRQFERLPATAKDDLGIPDAVFMFFNRLLAFDHVRHEIHIIAAADVRAQKPAQAYDAAIADIEKIARTLQQPLPKELLKARQRAASKLKVNSSVEKRKFIGAVKRAKEYIAAGDIFQVVLSQRLDFKPAVPPFEIYRALRRVNPSPYMYFLKAGQLHVLGSSPEMLVRVTGRKLEYRPIAGTLPRGRDEAEDKHLEQLLRNDTKECAEHIMLVDLGRNDVGRVSEYGSVKVPNLMYVERYSHVMHLVSAVEGKLREGLDPFDALAACFPAGTLSGAPKVRAMQIIEELEPLRRGIYGGSVLYADFAGNLDSCIAIRTMLAMPEGAHSGDEALAMRKPKGELRAYVQVGAGIVADSDPESEYQECINKAKAVLRAVEIARSGE